MDIVMLRPGAEHGRSIALPKAVAESLNLRSGKHITLRCGQSVEDDVTVIVWERLRSNHVVIARDLLHSLPLPAPLRLRLRRDDDGSLRLGPIVAILARSVRAPEGRFMSQTPYFAALVRTGRRIAVPTFVITPDSIDWERRKVRAYSVTRSGWVRVTIPLPDVVYDRVQTRRLDLLPKTREAKARLAEQPGVRIFNTGFLDKWETHQALEQPETEHLLPQTRLLTQREDLLDFARRFRTVYVKPAGGSLGKGIHVIQRGRSGRYRVTHYGSTRVRRIRNLRSPDIVWRRLQRMRKKRRYVVQQGINFARYQGRRFDMRLLLQKTGNGEWAVTAIYARVAPPGSLRANLDAGGKAVRSSRVLRSIFGRGGPKVLRRILRAGITVAETLEKYSEGTLGELGIDMGVDRRGRPWLIEANSKPIRQMEGPRRRLARSLRRPLHFARRLAGF